MKLGYIVVAFVIGAAAAFGVVKLREEKILTVSQIGYSHDKYKGTITVTGIMAGTSDFDKTVFGIMDVQEATCNAPGCKKVFIPVQYNGRHPAPGDEVKVKGAFGTDKGGIVLKAQTLTVVRHHDLKINQQPQQPQQPPKTAPRKWS